MKSGSLITSNFAVEQNKDVFALPGSIFEPNTEGTHKLIEDGAKCVRRTEDILVEYNMKPQTLPFQSSSPSASSTPDEKKELPPLSKTEEHIIQFLSSPKHADDIVSSSKLSLPIVLQTLTFLEIKQVIKKTSTQHYVLI